MKWRESICFSHKLHGNKFLRKCSICSKCLANVSENSGLQWCLCSFYELSPPLLLPQALFYIYHSWKLWRILERKQNKIWAKTAPVLVLYFMYFWRYNRIQISCIHLGLMLLWVKYVLLNSYANYLDSSVSSKGPEIGWFPKKSKKNSWRFFLKKKAFFVIFWPKNTFPGPIWVLKLRNLIRCKF